MWILPAHRGSFNRKERKEHKGKGLGWVPANERASTRMEPVVELPPIRRRWFRFALIRVNSRAPS